MSGSAERPLSQEEIDALLEQLQQEPTEVEALPASSAHDDASRPEVSPTVPHHPLPNRQLGMWEQVGDFPVRLSVEVGRAVAPLATWRKLGVGSRVTLDRLAQEPVALRLNGHLVGDGVVVLVGNRFGVQVKHWGEASQEDQ